MRHQVSLETIVGGSALFKAGTDYSKMHFSVVNSLRFTKYWVKVGTYFSYYYCLVFKLIRWTGTFVVVVKYYLLGKYTWLMNTRRLRLTGSKG